MKREMFLKSCLGIAIFAGSFFSKIGDAMASVADLLKQSLQEAQLSSFITGKTNSYAKSNPGEWAKVKAYLDGGARPTGNFTHMGNHLILDEDARRAVGGNGTQPSPLPANTAISAPTAKVS